MTEARRRSSDRLFLLFTVRIFKVLVKIIRRNKYFDMEENKAFNPAHISLLGANAVVLNPQLIAYWIK